MYSHKNLIHIFTILECIEKCWLYSKDYKTAQDFIFLNEQRDYNATLMMFTAIGEESKKIDRELKQSITSTIVWSDVAGMRDKISHDYRGIDAKILWNTIHKELYTLKEAVLQILDLLNPPKDLIDEILDTPYYQNLQYLK